LFVFEQPVVAISSSCLRTGFVWIRSYCDKREDSERCWGYASAAGL